MKANKGKLIIWLLALIVMFSAASVSYAAPSGAKAKITVKAITSKKYRVTVSGVRYPGVGVKKIKLRTWSNKKGQDDVKWHKPTKTNKKKKIYCVDFSINEHKHLGKYTSELYVYNKSGKRYYLKTKSFNVAQPGSGKTSITSSNVSGGTIKVKMTGITHKSRLKKVRFKAWSTDTNAKWYTASKQKNGSYTATINIKNHGSDRGTYTIAGYTVDIKGDYRKQSQVKKSMQLSTRKTPVINAKAAAVANNSSRALGIDVSHHNGTINWAKVKADGVRYAIIRCGFGSNVAGAYNPVTKTGGHDDNQWNNNVAGCEKNGIPYGVYIYSYATTTAQAKDEAQHCIRLMNSTCNKAKMELPVYLDMEDKVQVKLGKDQLANIANTWANTIKAAGYTKVGIYASGSWWNSQLANTAVYNNYSRWVAQWPYTYTNATTCTYTKTPYRIWQFSDNGRVNGISGAVDLNWVYNNNY